MKISEILSKYNTDKVSGHHYGETYDTIFSYFNKNDSLNILEIGTQKGGSLLAWKDYFPNAKVTGIDIVDVVSEKNPNINYIISDINDYKTEEMFDIVIDDGSHWLKDVVHVVSYFSKKLKTGGILVIEDVQNPELWYQVITTILSPYMEYNRDSKFEIKVSDLRGVNNQYDDFMFIVKKI